MNTILSFEINDNNGEFVINTSEGEFKIEIDPRSEYSSFYGLDSKCFVNQNQQIYYDYVEVTSYVENNNNVLAIIFYLTNKQMIRFYAWAEPSDQYYSHDASIYHNGILLRSEEL